MAYTGETIDVTSTLQRLDQSARQQGFDCFTLVEQAGTIIPYYTRKAETDSAPRIYVSTGMHGDEPAGPLAVLDLLEGEQLCRDIDWTLFPMLNPAGLKLNQRENHEGADLNRDYKEPATKEVQAHTEFIHGSEPWDLGVVVRW